MANNSLLFLRVATLENREKKATVLKIEKVFIFLKMLGETE